MPCTLRRLEVWQVPPKNCRSCRKLALPMSVKLSLHQACNIQATSTLLSHKICSRRLVNLVRRSQPPPNSSAGVVKTKSTKQGLNKIKYFWSGTGKRGSRFASKNNTTSPKAKKVMMEEGIDRSQSDSDSDSVIILTDDDDDKPIRQRLIEYREGFSKAASQEIEDDKSLIKHEIGNECNVASATTRSAKDYEEPRDIEGYSTSTVGVKDEYEDPRQREGFSTSTIGVKDSDNYENKQVCLKTKTNKGVKKKDASVESDYDEDEQFEKHFKQDINFIVAKFMVKKKVGFVCDIIPNPDPFEKKLRKLLDQADILIIKKSLDDGGKTFTPKELDLKKFLPKPAPPPPPNVSAISSTPGLSNEESPNTTQTLPVIDENVPQMPMVVSADSVNDLAKSKLPEKKAKPEKTFKFKQYCPPAPTKSKKLPGSLPKLLKPAVVFPSIKAKSFKIPRAAKTKQPKWVTNAAVWQWALTVDDNGQYSRTEKERKRVPWASLVPRRLCEEFQFCLVRGTIMEGDDCIWEKKEGVEKKDKDEVKRRREDFMWREKVLDKILGNGAHAGGWVSTRDPLGLDERDSGTGSLEVGNSTSNTIAGSDATEDLTENELNVSQQSLVTHIQTPTHTFCMDEVESDGTDCMDEKGETLDINKNVQKVSEPNLATLPGLRGPPPPVNRLISAPRILSQVLSVSEDLHSYPSPPPSVAPSVGFAFTRLSPVTPSVINIRTSEEDATTAQTVHSDYSATSQPLSVLSGLVATKRTRFKLF